MAYGVEMCKRVNSPRVKILYDMYHVQIMEGDIIRMMRDNIQYIGHFHTAGNPGRHEMDDTQEMNYRGIAVAIAEAGFQGFIAHEYSPLRDPLQSLEETLKIFELREQRVSTRTEVRLRETTLAHQEDVRQNVMFRRRFPIA